MTTDPFGGDAEAQAPASDDAIERGIEALQAAARRSVSTDAVVCDANVTRSLPSRSDAAVTVRLRSESGSSNDRR